MNRPASASTLAPIATAAASTEVGPLLRDTQALAPDTSVLDVAQQFLEPRHAGLLSLPVVDAMARPIGVISRYALMRVFLQPFGRELFGRRPVTELMNHEPLVLAVTTSIDEAARAIAAKIVSPITEDSCWSTRAATPAPAPSSMGCARWRIGLASAAVNSNAPMRV